MRALLERYGSLEDGEDFRGRVGEAQFSGVELEAISGAKVVAFGIKGIA